MIKTVRLAVALVGLPVLAGCVMAEKYEAEKARSLNFQRLLAQEEKRTAELDSEVKRTKREAAELEAKNRELAAQVQALREQLARLQEEADAMKEAALLERKANEEMRRMAKLSSKPKKVDVPGMEAEMAESVVKPDASQLSKTTPIYHQVKPGETLFRLSRKYGVSVDKVKEWNKLPDDIIEVGQRLIVGYE
ncbi:MAG TPA: LysM peptidoglycan-binding domain-containing protein [Nitrospiraceae bacterium]|nr:LysM peptidoglycan-binding domain-containing protein [Nitrospiraceae bacterium]